MFLKIQLNMITTLQSFHLSGRHKIYTKLHLLKLSFCPFLSSELQVSATPAAFHTPPTFAPQCHCQYLALKPQGLLNSGEREFLLLHSKSTHAMSYPTRSPVRSQPQTVSRLTGKLTSNLGKVYHSNWLSYLITVTPAIFAVASAC